MLRRLWSLATLIVLIVLGAIRAVAHYMALTGASSAADHDRQVQLDASSFLTRMLNEETGVHAR